MKRMFWLGIAGLLVVLAGCASPGDVEARREQGYRWAAESGQRITHDTDVNYANEMPRAQEWNVRSIFNLPASGALTVIIIALAVVLVIGIAFAVASYNKGVERSVQERRTANEREQHITERKRLDVEIAKTLAKAHDCTVCNATPKEQLAMKKVSEAAED